MANGYVESDGARLRPRVPRTRAGSTKNGVNVAEVVSEQAPAGDERKPGGHFAPGARTLQSKGGKTARRRDVLAKRLNLPDLTSDDRKRATALQRALLADYTRMSGGELSTDVALLTDQLALRAVGSRVAFAAGNATLGSRLADGCRSDILACRHLCGADSTSRKKGQPLPALDAAADAELDAEVERLMAQAKTSSHAEPGATESDDNNELDGEETES